MADKEERIPGRLLGPRAAWTGGPGDEKMAPLPREGNRPLEPTRGAVGPLFRKRRTPGGRDTSPASPPTGNPFSTGGVLPRAREATRIEGLKGVSLFQLSEELLARLKAGEPYGTDSDWVLGEELRENLGKALDFHTNRYGARRFYDLLRPILEAIPRSRFKGACTVDLGCGCHNPFGFSFLLLTLGAERAYAVDIDPILDPARAARALATCATWMLLDSRRILDPDRLPPEEVLRNLRGFDLAKLAAGDPSGIDPQRLVHRTDSVYELGLRDGEADVVFSVSFLEHLGRVDDVLESLRRITKVGGYGHHLIDFADHRVYPGLVASPFEFLKLETNEDLVFGSNRLRCSQFCALFEKHGFAVERIETARQTPLPPGEQAQLVEPYRSMDREDLERICARILVRRR